MRRMMACALALLAVTMTACEMRAEVSVQEDGSGTFGFVFGVEPFVLNAMPTGPGNPLDLFREELKNSSVPWTVKDFAEPGLEGVRATLAFRDVQHLRDMMRELSDAEGAMFGSGDNLDDSLVLEQIDGGWAFRASGATPAGRTEQKLQGTGLESQLPDVPELDKMFRFEFHVTLPGEPASHNATEVSESDGRTTFIWRAGVFDTHTVKLRAQTDPVSPGFPVVPTGAGLALLGGAGFLLRGKRPSSGPPPVVLEGLPVVSHAPATVGAVVGERPGEDVAAAYAPPAPQA